jgi:hypothetical protein
MEIRALKIVSSVFSPTDLTDIKPGQAGIGILKISQVLNAI